MPDYPQTVSEVIELNAKYKPTVLSAVRRFAKTQPWQGTLKEQRDSRLRPASDTDDFQ